MQLTIKYHEQFKVMIGFIRFINLKTSVLQPMNSQSEYSIGFYF